MVLVIWEQWKNSLSEQFTALYHGKILTDVVIEVENKRFEAHSFVICMFSKVFQILLEEARHDPDTEIPFYIIFTEISFEAISSLISFMYHGEMVIDDIHIPDVLYLTKVLEIKGLEDLEAYLSDNAVPESNQQFCMLRNIGSDDELVMTKKIEAEIIPIKKEITIETSNSETFEFPPVGKESQSCSDLEIGKEETIEDNKKRKSNHRKRKSDRTPKNKKKEAKDEDVPNLDLVGAKNELLNEVERFAIKKDDAKVKDSWPLDRLGIELLYHMSETFCGKLKVSNGGELLDDTKNPSKIAKNRFRREMSYFWHQLLALSSDERTSFVVNIADQHVRDVYREILCKSSVTEILRKFLIPPNDLTCCIFLLILSRKLSLKLITESYKFEDVYFFYKERIEQAISMYQTTDLFLTDICDKCWVPYACVNEQIKKFQIERVDRFDATIQNALRMCGEGILVEHVLAMEDVGQYSEDLKKILEHHLGREITLPLRPYEERIKCALSSWQNKFLTMDKAALEYIVSYSTLCKRALATEDKESSFPTNCSKEKRTKLFYKGDKEPVISADNTRRGQKSKTDKLIRAALLSCKEGMTPEEAFKYYGIKNSRTQTMIKFNVNRKDAPLDQSYTMRFKNAIDEVNINKKTINEASKLHLINYSALREWFYVKNTKQKITKASAKNRKKPKFEEQIEAAIRSIKSGMSVIDAFHYHGMKDKKNLSILKYNVERRDCPLYLDYETRLNMAIKAVRSGEMSCIDAGKEYCVNSSTLRYYELQDAKVPSKNVHNFEEQMRGALLACREGMSLSEACIKFNIKTPKYQKILEYNLNREDAPINTPYSIRMLKAKESILNAEMTIAEASDDYMVSPAVLSKYFNRAKKSNKVPKPLKHYDLLSNKFDVRMISAIKCCREGMSIGKAFKKNRLRSERSLDCLQYNAARVDAPIDVPYSKRISAAVEAVMSDKMRTSQAARQFIVSPFTLDKTIRGVRSSSGKVTKVKAETNGKRYEFSNDTGTITVIPGVDLKDDNDSVIDVIKQEPEESVEKKVSVRTRLGATRSDAKGDSDKSKPSVETSAKNDLGDDKAIKIQILRRYSKGNNADQANSICQNNYSPEENHMTKRSPNETRSSIPPSTYEQRLQKAVELCFSKDLERRDVARKFQVSLGELNDAYKSKRRKLPVRDSVKTDSRE